MTKRILLINSDRSDRWARTQMELLAAGLPRGEFDVQVCLLSRDRPGPAKPGDTRAAANVGDATDAAVSRTIVEHRWPIDPRACWRLRGLMRRWGPDVVHTWDFSSGMHGRVAALAAGVQCVVARGPRIDDGLPEHVWAIERGLARRTYATVADTSAAYDGLVERGLPAARLRTIPDGVPPCKPSPNSRADLLAALGLPPDVRLIGAVEPLTVRSRVKPLIWFYDLLRVVSPDAHLVIVGSGPQRWELARFRDRQEARGCVHFVDDAPDSRRPPATDVGRDATHLVGQFDVMWSATPRRGLSGPMLSAMSAGVPVVAADSAGHREMIVDGQTGFLPHADDRAGFARITLKLLEDGALARRIGDAARRHVTKKFDAHTTIERYAALYREVSNRT